MILGPIPVCLSVWPHTHKQFWGASSASQNSTQLNPTHCWHCPPVNSITSYETSVLPDCPSSFRCLFHVQVVTCTPDLLVTHSSVQFSRSVVSESLRPHGLQHTRPPCPSPIPGVYSNSCSLSQWCHPTISSSVVPFSSHLQSFPASGSFPKSHFFTSGGQSIGVSASHQSF